MSSDETIWQCGSTDHAHTGSVAILLFEDKDLQIARQETVQLFLCTVLRKIVIHFRVKDGTQWTAYVDIRVERRRREEVVFWFQ